MKYCFWSVASGLEYSKMFQACASSAIANGVKEEFILWSNTDIKGVKVLPCGDFDKAHYMFKFRFLERMPEKFPNYDYYIFLDSDTYFVRNPGDLTEQLKHAPVHVCMESDCEYENNTRPDWWGCPLNVYVELMRKMGARGPIYNTNAGFWIVHRHAVKRVVELAFEFWQFAKNEGYTFTEEAPLAYVGHMLMGDQCRHRLKVNRECWASDWTGVFSGELPENRTWDFTDYLSGEKYQVRPAIVHAMRSKDVLTRLISLN